MNKESELLRLVEKERSDLRAQVDALTKERDQWEKAAGQSFVRAESLEDRAIAAEQRCAELQAKHDAIFERHVKEP